MCGGADQTTKNGKVTLRIGVLEDNPAILDVYQLAFEMAGHTAVYHTSGDSLLARLFAPDSGSALPYDVLVIDLGLPGELSGRDVIERIHQHLPDGALPMVVVSGAAAGELDRLRTEFPFLQVLSKPVRLQRLFQVLDYQVEKARRVTGQPPVSLAGIASGPPADLTSRAS